MGTWGLGTFDDDLARDWLEDLHDSDPVAFLTHCLDLSDAPSPGRLACIGAVCSAEIVHALCCQPRDQLPEDAANWLKENRSLDLRFLIPSAIDALNRVVQSDSQMRQQWEDAPELYPQWMARMTDLIGRLEQLQHPPTETE